jgi:hypothetical protein
MFPRNETRDSDGTFQHESRAGISISSSQCYNSNNLIRVLASNNKQALENASIQVRLQTDKNLDMPDHLESETLPLNDEVLIEAPLSKKLDKFPKARAYDSEPRSEIQQILFKAGLKQLDSRKYKNTHFDSPKASFRNTRYPLSYKSKPISPKAEKHTIDVKQLIYGSKSPSDENRTLISQNSINMWTFNN